MDGFLTVFGGAQWLGIEQILTALLLTCVLSSFIATIYRATFQGLSYSRGFVHTMILGSMVVCMLIMAIGNNLARGLGILGTLAIVRFRTSLRDPRDMVFLFCSFATGIACGANTYSVAIVGTFIIGGTAVLLHWSPFASRREYEALVRFLLPPDSVAEEDVKTAMRTSCSAFSLIAMREAVQGDMLEYSYQVRLIDPSYQSDLVEALRKIPDVVEPSLLLQRTTVEL